MIKIALVLIVLHGPDGHDIAVSLDEITSVHCKIPGAKDSGLFTQGVNAIINLTDGKFVSVAESCEQLRNIIVKAQEKEK